ncbi:alpha/beta-hydrolase [Cercophora scortea]|uniref:Alpha/beta-hydrolase n=1 Tax=Cercophora scortea TaxID=314031 RepID=A0AAE0MMM0_9PEZI|nr:alpha/beta-hydrolase [Cercophora scortea]
MSTWTLGPHPHMASSCIVLGVIGVSLGLTLRSLSRDNPLKEPCIKSPRKTLLPSLSKDETAALPYPPDILPGGRDVETPYGNIKVFEWGPEDGEKVLLMHGISVPCLALADLAQELVSKNYRVMLFDFFGRGYSDAPTDIPYDIRLYTTQILLVLASSNLQWTGNDAFHLIGYSLGGGIGVSFTQYFSHMVKSLVLVAGGGLIRHEHVSWKSRMLYSTTGLFPEWLLQYLVRQRLTPKEATTEEEMAGEVARPAEPPKRQKNSDASGGSSYDNALLTTTRGGPGVSVSSVLAWQLRNQQGFIPAFMSSIRHAPIYDRQNDWQALGQLLSERREPEGSTLPGLRGGRVLLVLGSTDPVIVQEELVHDATAVLGEDGFEAVLLDCGHEIVMTKAKEVADLAAGFWGA